MVINVYHSRHRHSLNRESVYDVDKFEMNV